MNSLRFNQFLHSVADSGVELLRTRLRSTFGQSKTLTALCHELLSTRGEASGIAIARDIVNQFQNLDKDERLQFFEMVNDQFSVDADDVAAAAEAFCKLRDPASLRRLTEQVESQCQELVRRINMAPGGTATIVEMRRDLLELVKHHPHLEPVEYDLKHLLFSWFNRGFLEIEQINWETPAIILEKLIQYESVHAMKGWQDLRGRLADDRRCFAFFHPTLPNEPLIFVEVALVQGLSESIEPIIDATRPVTNPQKADTAIFYSINNCQQGLKGVSFGNLLIKQVVEHLSREFPNLKHFSTLSPIPGFRRWFDSILQHPDHYAISKQDHELMLKMQSDDWFEDEKLLKSLKPALQGLVAYYLAYARKKDEPLDPVARFHLRNGARLKRLNWLGDSSPNGFRQSAGMLANYIYEPDKIVQNHEAHVKDRKFAIDRKIYDLVPPELRTNQPKKRQNRKK